MQNPTVWKFYSYATIQKRESERNNKLGDDEPFYDIMFCLPMNYYRQGEDEENYPNYETLLLLRGGYYNPDYVFLKVGDTEYQLLKKY